MIVSFHPAITADENRIIAGRPPSPEDVRLMERARAVVLPQGVTEETYRLARRGCAYVFPNYDARFAFPGKIGVAGLCLKYGIPHPRTRIYENVRAFHQDPATPEFPVVLKCNQGGEGEGVFLVEGSTGLQKALEVFEGMERAGWPGFVLQEYVPNSGATLRVVVLGEDFVSYWKKGATRDVFAHSLSSGGVLDKTGDPRLQERGIELAREVCRSTGINLAGMDMLFARDRQEPLLLEINYFFGRRGLGGSIRFYRLLEQAVQKWVQGLPAGTAEPAGPSEHAR